MPKKVVAEKKVDKVETYAYDMKSNEYEDSSDDGFRKYNKIYEMSIG